MSLTLRHEEKMCTHNRLATSIYTKYKKVKKKRKKEKKIVRPHLTGLGLVRPEPRPDSENTSSRPRLVSGFDSDSLSLARKRRRLSGVNDRIESSRPQMDAALFSPSSLFHGDGDGDGNKLSSSQNALLFLFHCC